MSGLVAALVVAWLAVAAAGTGTAGLFWLTPVALAGLVVTGAWGVGRVLRRPAHRPSDVTGPRAPATVTALPPARTPTHDLSGRRVGSHRRAA